MSHRNHRAFTLVEILIVVVILGILASIVVPQFARATEDATRTATFDQLTKIRRAMDVYTMRNAGTHPDITDGDGTWGSLLLGGNNAYLKNRPANMWIGGPNARRIEIGNAADTSWHQDYGWVYNPITGEVWAAGYDLNDEPLPRP